MRPPVRHRAAACLGRRQARSPVTPRGRIAAMTSNMKMFTGNANKELAQEIASYLGISLGNITVRAASCRRAGSVGRAGGRRRGAAWPRLHRDRLTAHQLRAQVDRFADGEVNVMVHDNVRGKDVYIVQPTCPPVNENFMELVLMVRAADAATIARVT